MNEYTITNETNKNISETNELKKFLDFSLNYLKIDSCIFNIIFVEKEKIKEINKAYRGKDSVTDVISFALEDDKTFVKTNFRVLGDIYICYEKAIEQSEEYGHSLLREILFLSIHGLLHLLGYDHMNKSDEKIMFELQERILDEYGIKRWNKKERFNS